MSGGMKKERQRCIHIYTKHPLSPHLIVKSKPLLSPSSSLKSTILPKKNLFNCMAANLQSRGLASFTKQFVSQVRSRDSTILRRGVHVSTYDKNPDEEHTFSAVVPDNIIQSQTQQYWAPHPKTGVFGPARDEADLAREDDVANGGADSVLEQKAFFRPLEDLDKPHHP